jgi:hypothetical protein
MIKNSKKSTEENANTAKCIICEKEFIRPSEKTLTCSEECFKKQLGKLFSSFFVE